MIIIKTAVCVCGLKVFNYEVHEKQDLKEQPNPCVPPSTQLSCTGSQTVNIWNIWTPLEVT